MLQACSLFYEWTKLLAQLFIAFSHGMDTIFIKKYILCN